MKAEMKVITKVLFVLVGLFLILITLVLAVIYSIVLVCFPNTSMPFDAKIWPSHPGSEHDNTRGNMAQDLVHNRLNTGMKQQNIIQLLGMPDKGMTPQVYKYYLGAGQIFQEYTNLWIYFDQYGNYSSAQYFAGG